MMKNGRPLAFWNGCCVWARRAACKSFFVVHASNLEDFAHPTTLSLPKMIRKPSKEVQSKAVLCVHGRSSACTRSPTGPCRGSASGSTAPAAQALSSMGGAFSPMRTV